MEDDGVQGKKANNDDNGNGETYEGEDGENQGDDKDNDKSDDDEEEDEDDDDFECDIERYVPFEDKIALAEKLKTTSRDALTQIMRII